MGSLLRYVRLSFFLHNLHFEILPKDCIVLSIVHPDPSKTPYRELRQVIPVRLTTDHWSLNNDLEYFTPDDLETQPELRY